MAVQNIGKLNHIQSIDGVKFCVQKQFNKWRHVVIIEGSQTTTGPILDTKAWAIHTLPETMLSWGCAEKSEYGRIVPKQ
jgi:hypothetical protein